MMGNRTRLLIPAIVVALVSVSLADAKSQSRPPDANPPKVMDENTDKFCKYEGSADNKPFQCFEKRRYPLGTPCLCPGFDRIGKITHQ